MASRDQDRAALAFEHVDSYSKKADGEKKKYATMVYKLPSLLQTAGLCQTLHFAQSRDEPNAKLLLDHLAKQLQRVNASITDSKTLLERARKADLGEYLALTDEAMACAAWYRRLVQGVLAIDPADADQGAD